MVAVAIGLLLLLGGCGLCPVKPNVEVPIAVPCKVEVPLQPTYRFLPPYEDIYSGTRDLLGDREVALAYENSLRTALQVCTQ